MIRAIIFDLFGVLLSLEKEGGERKVIEENVELIKKIRDKYKIGIISNAGPEALSPLKESGVYDAFAAVVLSSETGISKPEREVYEIALERMNVKSEQTVFVDDSSENVEAAELLGIKSVLYKNPAQLKEALTQLGIEA